MELEVPDLLAPFLESTGPNNKGEWGLYCPLHEDNKRSASINFDKDRWFCHGCGKKGTVRTLLRVMGQPNGIVNTFQPNRSNGGTYTRNDEVDALTEGMVAGWHSALLSRADLIEQLEESKGLNLDTLKRFELGWNDDLEAFTIPVRDAEGDCINCRFYQFDVPDERRKIWSVKGRGSPALYPYTSLEHEAIIVVEGEWDALLTIQQGFNAVTRTASADTWRDEWNSLFRGKLVYVCHDMDVKGQAGNAKVAESLKRVAEELFVIHLPYEITSKHGKDLSDYWLEGYSPDDFVGLLDDAEQVPMEGPIDQEYEAAEPIDLSVVDTYDAANAGQPQRLRVTITGKQQSTFLLPKTVQFSCGQEAGVKCALCPMNEQGYNGEHETEVNAGDQDLLEMAGATSKDVNDLLRKRLGAQRCNFLRIGRSEEQTMELLYVRPEVDTTQVSYDAGDYAWRKVYNVGTHTTQPNNTVEFLGTTMPHPKDQTNAFLSWKSRSTETSIDKFEMTEDKLAAFEVFRANGRGPLRKCIEIARELEGHVTHIYGRTPMHVLMDLAYHSLLGFEFGGVMERKGWLDVLILGDTRTGKSEAAAALLRHYGAGEVISCESASFAGVVGGLEQHAGREWVVKWGAIPINDRRLVVLDEVSGLSHEEIARMSSIRSSGEAQLTKIHAERTYARTRLIWLSNPRRGRMAGFTYGVQAIPELIGNPEDVARFDLAMTVAADEVTPEEINREHVTADRQIYHGWLCHELLMWAWSRKPHQVQWMPGAQELVYDAAVGLGRSYVETPPLVQAANVRVKLARVAVALAARTFSTYDGENVYVNHEHVDDAVKFLTILYGQHGFGYFALSEEALEDAATAEANLGEAKLYLEDHIGLAKFLRSMGHFRSQDLQDMMNMSNAQASATITTLWNLRMISRDKADIRIVPVMHRILREVKE